MLCISSAAFSPLPVWKFASIWMQQCSEDNMLSLLPRCMKRTWETTAVVICLIDSHGVLHRHLFKQEIYENFLLKTKTYVRKRYAVLRWFSHSYLSRFLLSVERQEAQSAGVKKKGSQKTLGRRRFSADSGVVEMANLVTSSETHLRQEHQLLGINTSLLDDCWWNW